MEYWICFFLTAVYDTAVKGRQTFENILSLRNETEPKLLAMGRRAEKANQLLNHLYVNPIVTTSDVKNALNITHTPASVLLQDFVKANILIKGQKVQRRQSYIFKQYIELFS